MVKRLLRKKLQVNMEEDDLNPAGKPLYRLYFKGLVTEEKEMLLAGFGVAICGDKDDLLFDLKVSIHDPTITLLEVELIALKSGLNQAVSLGINHISICCDHEYIFELVSFPWLTRICFNLIINVFP